MVRTQIRLPDEIFAKAKKFCEAREISLSELTRRGIEYMVEVDSLKSGKPADWQLPQPRNLGWKGLDHARIKELAQLTHSELTHSAKK